MDPQLTKQLNRRRLILENSLETSITNEKEVNNFVPSTTLITDVRQPNFIKNNFLEKIKKFESFSDSQIKITQQNISDRSRNNTELINKINKLNLEPALKKTCTTNKFEFADNSGLCNDNKQKQDKIHEKIKQFESSPKVSENITLKENTNNLVKKHSQTSNELAKTLKSKSSSKSDYNNWEFDKKWVFSTDFPDLNNKKNLLINKIFRKKKKNSGVTQNDSKTSSKN